MFFLCENQNGTDAKIMSSSLSSGNHQQNPPSSPRSLKNSEDQPHVLRGSLGYLNHPSFPSSMPFLYPQKHAVVLCVSKNSSKCTKKWCMTCASLFGSKLQNRRAHVRVSIVSKSLAVRKIPVHKMP